MVFRLIAQTQSTAILTTLAAPSVWLPAVGAILPFALLSVMPRAFVWGVSAVMLNLAIASCAARTVLLVGSTLYTAAYFAAGAALFWSAAGAVGRWWGVGAESADGDTRTHGHCLRAIAQASAMTAGVVAISAMAFVLTVRGLYAIMEVRQGAPLVQNEAFRFGVDGLVVIAALMASCVVAMYPRQAIIGSSVERFGSGRLVTPLFGLTVALAVWISFLQPAVRSDGLGGYERTAWSLLLLVYLTIVVAAFAIVKRTVRDRERWRAACGDPDALLGVFGSWTGFRRSCAAVGVVLVLLVCYQIVAPPSVRIVGGRAAAVVASGCAMVSGLVFFSLAGAFPRIRRIADGERPRGDVDGGQLDSPLWSTGLAEIGMGLVTLSVAAAALVAVPNEPADLQARFPLVFNAAMAGLAVMTWFWAWLGQVWRQQLDRGRAWTLGGHLVPVTGKFAFFVACIAVSLGSLMTMWPRLRPVATGDDSLGRMISAVGAHFMLLLALLWARRTIGRSSLGVLTIMTIASLAGFIMIRSRPMIPTVIEAALGAG